MRVVVPQTPAGGIDYRYTPFRKHIADELADQFPGGRVQYRQSDVLAVEELLLKLADLGIPRTDPAVHRVVNRQRFFYAINPEERQYVPVKVVASTPNSRSHPSENDFQRTFEERLEQEKQAQRRATAARLGGRIRDWLRYWHDDLISLLTWMDRYTEDVRGVALVARTGAGKSVAARKAFYDCFFAEPATPAALRGRLPIWLTWGIRRHSEWRGMEPTNDDVLDRIVELAQLPRNKLDRSRARQFLMTYLIGQDGPPLLIFGDLNAAPSDDHGYWAKQVIEFQHRLGKAFLDPYQARPAASGTKTKCHRFIVAYRSTNRDATVLQLLDARVDDRSPVFGLYDFVPVEHTTATSYLKNALRFERDVLARFASAAASSPTVPATASGGIAPETTPAPPVLLTDEQIEEHGARFGSLLERFGPESTLGDESLISTPLLMHFAAILTSKQHGEWRSLSDLYRLVIESHLERDKKQYPELWTRLGEINEPESHILGAMTRIALAILSKNAQQPLPPHEEPGESGQSPGKAAITGASPASTTSTPASTEVTRLTVREANEILDNPSAETITWDRPDWHPAAWYKRHGDVYYKRRFSPQQIGPLLTLSLLRREADQLGLIHDSMLYYLAGAFALVHYEQPLLPVRLHWKWRKEIVRRLYADPGMWRLPVGFLGGELLDKTDLRRPVVKLLFLEMLRCCAAEGHVVLIERYLGGISDVSPFAELSAAFAQTMIQFGRRHPEHFWTTVVGLMPNVFDEIGVDSVALQNEFDSRPGMGWLQRWSIATIAKRVSATPPDETTVTSGFRTDEVLSGHRGTVTSLAVLPDGRFVSGSWDYTLRVWDLTKPPGDSERVIDLQGHTDRVTSVCMLPDGRIVSGSSDNTVMVWDLSQPLDSPARVTVLEWHARPVTSVCVLPADANHPSRIVSCSKDKTLRVWDLSKPLGSADRVIVLEGHTSWVWSVCVLPADGIHPSRIVSCSKDKTVHVWDLTKPIDDPGRVTVLEGHTDWVLSVCALPADGNHPSRIVSASDDKTVRVWDLTKPIDDPGRVTVLEVHSDFKGHPDYVMSIAVLPDPATGSAWIVSGSRDNTVRVWDLTKLIDDPGRVIVLEGHSDLVTCIAVLTDGRFVSGSWDDTLRIWSEVPSADENPADRDDDVQSESEPSENSQAARIREVAWIGPAQGAFRTSDEEVHRWTASETDILVDQFELSSDELRPMAFGTDANGELAIIDKTGRIRYGTQFGVNTTSKLPVPPEFEIGKVVLSAGVFLFNAVKAESGRRAEWSNLPSTVYLGQQLGSNLKTRAELELADCKKLHLDRFGTGLVVGKRQSDSRLQIFVATPDDSEFVSLIRFDTDVTALADGPGKTLWVVEQNRLRRLNARDWTWEPGIDSSFRETATIAAASTDGRWLAVGVAGPSILVFDSSATLVAATHLPGLHKQILALAWQPGADGRLLAVGSEYGLVLFKLRGHELFPVTETAQP